jgi:PKD repeat protein
MATMVNCTVSANTASEGGGVFSTTLTNSIVFYNTATFESNYDGGSQLNYCCTTPIPLQGAGNLDIDPQLADPLHLSANSPCIGRGLFSAVSGLDIDGEPWANPPSIGCDEYQSGSVTGALSVVIVSSATNVSVGFTVWFEALFAGRVSSSKWDFGDGTVVSNALQSSHSWSIPGDYVVTLSAWNESHLAGVTTTTPVHVVVQPIHYVTLNSSSPQAPYSSWATAATNIQDAVDAASVEGALILVSNGVYQGGVRVVYGGSSNRLAVTKPVVVQSVNGPGATVIHGYRSAEVTNQSSAVRCVYLTNQATLAGFTLTNGATPATGDVAKEQSGGAVWCESPSAVISNWVLIGNSAQANGGASYSGTLQNCTLSGNSASSGAGAYGSALLSCLLNDNSATSYGGGASLGWLSNCTVSNNLTTGYSSSGG